MPNSAEPAQIPMPNSAWQNSAAETYHNFDVNFATQLQNPISLPQEGYQDVAQSYETASTLNTQPIHPAGDPSTTSQETPLVEPDRPVDSHGNYSWSG
jgi:hypothetical protein